MLLLSCIQFLMHRQTMLNLSLGQENFWQSDIRNLDQQAKPITQRPYFAMASGTKMLNLEDVSECLLRAKSAIRLHWAYHG